MGTIHRYGIPGTPSPLPPLLCPSPLLTHQFCSSSSTSRIPSSSNRTCSWAGKPPCHRQQLQEDPHTPGGPTLRHAAGPLPHPLENRDPQRGVSGAQGPAWSWRVPGGWVRKGSPARPGPRPCALQEASLPPGLIVLGKRGGRTEPPRRTPRPLRFLPGAARRKRQRDSQQPWGGLGPSAPAGRSVGRRVGAPTQQEPSQHRERRERGICWGLPLRCPRGAQRFWVLGPRRGSGQGSWTPVFQHWEEGRGR